MHSKLSVALCLLTDWAAANKKAERKKSCKHAFAGIDVVGQTYQIAIFENDYKGFNTV